jgi:predicted glycogen debranching enzyme
MSADLPLRRMPWTTVDGRNPEMLVGREWLIANGLGGYSSGTVSGACTRRYHGLLIAALPAPLGRVVMLNHLAEELRLPGGNVIALHGEELVGQVAVVHGESYLAEFRLEAGLPVWIYRFHEFVLEKRVVQPHFQNTTLVNYRLIGGSQPLRLRLRPSLNFRGHESPVSQPLALPYRAIIDGQRAEISDAAGSFVRMYFLAEEGARVFDNGRVAELEYRLEKHRGYEFRGQLYSPGYFRCMLHSGATATLVASTEEWEVLESLAAEEVFVAERERRQQLIAVAVPEARDAMGAELVLAADQLIISPATRRADAARARAAGEDVRTIIAGYHWFTDWGRDTMISLEGLTLCTGRAGEAAWILRTFARYVRDGLLPNLFPEGENEGLYHTADATLWYFHAIDRYVQTTGDVETLDWILPILHEIVRHHLQGTQFGIGVDPEDGLLRQGAEGYQLTWMDAKVDGWVVTPRRGKAVEVNALWYNALCLMERWTRQRQQNDAKADELAQHAARVRVSFNSRFWMEADQYLYDVVDGETGDDVSFRPNQVFSISLPNPVLDQSRWASVLNAVMDRLCTPMGLRTLAPGDPNYKPRYNGDLRARDAAYHQGTVWAWLIGPMIDAWMRAFPNDTSTPRRLLEGLDDHLHEACIGSISEIFDAEAPYYARGCVAQAWSVAEALRCWVKTSNLRT